MNYLIYELKCFFNYVNKFFHRIIEILGKSLAMMAECYEHLHQFRRVLVIYEQCLSHSHHDRWNVESKIERLSAEVKNNPIEEINIEL
jgi:hypothetical protein